VLAAARASPSDGPFLAPNASARLWFLGRIRYIQTSRCVRALCGINVSNGRIDVVEIELTETDRLDWALKQFRRRMIRSGLFKDMRRKRFYEKPSEARKAKTKAAERRRHKDRKRARAARRLAF
jgi:small subunit ribosomal protein S21